MATPDYSILLKLPYHPTPFDGESLSSFLMRVALGNNIESAYQFWGRVFPEHRGQLIRFLDLSPNVDGSLPWGRLPALLGISEEQLSAMSLFDFFENIGCSGVNSSPREFSGKRLLSKKLRFCPECLRQFGGYMLIWKIPSVQICDKHRCLLQHLCPTCGSELSSEPLPSALTECPNCQAKLETAPREVPDKAVLNELSECVFMARLLLRHDFVERVETGEIGRILEQRIETYMDGISRSNTLRNVVLDGLDDLMLIDGVLADCVSLEARPPTKKRVMPIYYCACKLATRLTIKTDLEVGIIAARYRFLRRIYWDYRKRVDSDGFPAKRPSFSKYALTLIENYE